MIMKLVILNVFLSFVLLLPEIADFAAGCFWGTEEFYHGAAQKFVAMKFKKKGDLSKAWKAPITTEISEAKKFWLAEEEDQQYLVKHPGGYDNHFVRKLNFDDKVEIKNEI